MDKTIILAVAGSGKTSFIIDSLNLEKRFLLITYTINNTRNLKESIIKKFGYFPENIDLYSYYPFLFSFCVKPFLGYRVRPSGIFWDIPPQFTNRLKRTDKKYYITKDRRLYHNRLAKLLEIYEVLPDINQRLEKYYDCLYIDEVQDFAGHDFNLLKSIANANIELKLVGDFFQHTFDTSRDGNTNSTLHADYDKYQARFGKMGISIDTEYLDKSYRCSPATCEFITNNLGVNIYSHKDTETIVKFIDSEEEADSIYENDSIVKLFYRESYKYKCYSRNWGDCKGENCYEDVCVVINPTTLKHFKNDTLHELKPVSKNKLYVACSRAKGNLYFVPEKLIKKNKK